jgi:hypothetical protein
VWLTGFTVFPTHIEKCHRWANAARDAIVSLGPEYYNSEINGEFTIRYVEWDNVPGWVEHEGLQIVIYQPDGKEVYGYMDDQFIVFTQEQMENTKWNIKGTQSLEERKKDCSFLFYGGEL